MNCTCGHDDTEHLDSAGRCEGQCYDSDYGTYKCLCFAYTEEPAA